MITPTLVHIRWESVTGATGWEIQIDGKKVATAGAKARTTKLSVKDGAHTISIIDLPARKQKQELKIEAIN